MTRTTPCSHLSLTVAALALLACDPSAPLVSQTPADLDETESTPQDEFISLDCGWSDAQEATETPIAPDTELGPEWLIEDGAPDWALPEDIAMYFSEASWEYPLEWSDGTMYDLTFTLDEIVQFRHATKIESNDDDLFLIDAIVSVELPDADLRTTRAVTFTSSYSEFIWSMGGSMTFVVAEQEQCENALVVHGRYSFEGPYDLLLLAQSRESGMQTVVGVLDN